MQGEGGGGCWAVYKTKFEYRHSSIHVDSWKEVVKRSQREKNLSKCFLLCRSYYDV